MSAPRTGRFRGDEGVSAVEFAIVGVLVLIPIALGMIELGSVMRDHLMVSTAVRAAVRSAAGGPADPCVIGSGGSCVPSLAVAAANSAEKGVLGVPIGTGNYLMVYKANDAGFPGTGTTMPSRSACGASVPSCVVFDWIPTANGGAGGFEYARGSWDPTNIDACLPDPEQVGVFLRLEHGYITRVGGATLAISDKAVMRFKPLAKSICADGVR